MDWEDSMQAIVFGGSGFIGSHVADVLVERGYQVKIFDHKKSAYLGKNQKMIMGDVLDAESVLLAVQGCDAVYNFAGIANIDECKEKPVEVVKYNVLGNVNILEACRKVQIKRFVFASSTYVYGDSGTFYKSSKQACELFIEDYNKLYNVPYTILRYGSLYGDRADERNSIYRLLRDALTEGKITYYGSGDEVREFIHVIDAARASVDILADSYQNEYVILTGQRSMKYRDLLEMIKEILKGKLEIVYQPRRSDTHYKMVPYVFSPRLGKKMSPGQYVDLGQGLLRCLEDIHSRVQDNQDA